LREPRKDFIYVDVSAVSRETCSIHDAKHIAAETAPSRARKIIKAGDTIYATVRPTLRRIALVPTELDDHIASTAFCVVRPDRTAADPRFIYYLLQTDCLNECIAKHESGASYPAVNDKHVLDQRIALPPLAEQEAIANIFSTVQRAIEIEDRLIATVRDLKRAAMRQFFTHGLRGEPQRDSEIGPVPASWHVVPFEELREFLQYGTSAKCDYHGRGHPVVRIPNITDGRINANDLKWVELSGKDVHATQLHFGDLLFVRTNGVRDRVGSCALYKGEPTGALFASYLIRAHLRRNVVDPDYLCFYLTSDAGRAQIEARAVPAADGKFNINTSHIDSFLVAVPPSLAEQQDISRSLQTLSIKVSIHEKRKRLLQELFELLLTQLMAGKICTTGLDTSSLVPSASIEKEASR
jgi:type I restriction enzyme S subunit